MIISNREELAALLRLRVNKLIAVFTKADYDCPPNRNDEISQIVDILNEIAQLGSLQGPNKNSFIWKKEIIDIIIKQKYPEGE